jgi:NTE family protein
MVELVRRPFTGLALGGGGARGLAHIGVLQAIEESKIPIDAIAGSSMGGLIAALYAAGVNLKDIEHEAIKLSKLTNLVKLIELSSPRRGLFKTDRIKSYLYELLGIDRQIEELPLPLALTAVDLISRKKVILTRGSLINAIMATTCVPGLFPPIEMENKILVDGGVLNNVPADIVRKMGAELVIAVDVNRPLDNDQQWANMSGFAPFSKILPRFTVDLYQTETIMIDAITETNFKKVKPDFIIKPSIPAEVNVFFGFTHAESTIAIGKKATHEHIPAIKNRLKKRARFPRAAPLIDHL